MESECLVDLLWLRSRSSPWAPAPLRPSLPGPTPLVRTIEKVQIGTDLTLNENLHTAAGDRTAIQVLVANAYAREQATNLVARIPAIPVQQAGKAEWLSGVREGVREDVQTADAVFAILSGDKVGGWQEIDSQALNDESNRVNKLTSQADRVLGVKFPPSAPKN